MAWAMASIEARARSSSAPPALASVRSASARAMASARWRSVTSTGSAARVSRSRVKAITSASTMASALMASPLRAWWLALTTFCMSSTS